MNDEKDKVKKVRAALEELGGIDPDKEPDSDKAEAAAEKEVKKEQPENDK